MKKFVYIIVVLFLSCTTELIEYEADLDVIIVEEINSCLDESNISKAFQLLVYYEDITGGSEQLDESKIKLHSLMTTKLNEYILNEDWSNFFILYQNLEILRFNTDEYQYNNYLYQYLIKDTSAILSKSGVFLGEDELDYSKLSSDQLVDLEIEYNKVSPSSDYPKLVSELNSRNTYIKSDIGNNEYIDGSITVFVNKGISFQNGVGTQDIVVGSGFFIDKLGYAVTNYHVVESLVDTEYEGVANLYIKLNGLIDKIPAKIVGWDKVLDLALIKVSHIPEYVFSFAKDNDISIGDRVLALGSPGGLGSTVTSGIVSAKNRSLLEIGSVIQIDSAINPGNSGGPLIDNNNRVTNVVFAGIEDFEGINFAIPVKYLKNKLQELYMGGEVKHPWLGAGLVYRKNSIEVVYVKPKSPAFYLGLNKSDIIVSINEKKFSSIIDIQDYIMGFNIGEIVKVNFKRGSSYYEKYMTLGERPKVIMESIITGDTSDKLYIPLFGMDIRYTGKILWNKEYLINDVYPGTIADELSLQVGDIIEVKDWEYNKDLKSVILQFVIQSKKEGFWEKSIQVAAPINVNFFI
ncbi:PDZ domain-containing protein [Thiospirochaeta perfilievii]|uniref:PDZ domain-containing protein n=1 Tax=Thiospirochaeta perfilievii TaxID=252967 RepID=A0A5C1QI64_9SPIO|nr:trypsin-like peptidase domain-containing protein [Thiospirochaeta perfilievii]QEN06224.1 PDZ domain-containing protein [Thiospirochaeta perfilievii]